MQPEDSIDLVFEAMAQEAQDCRNILGEVISVRVSEEMIRKKEQGGHPTDEDAARLIAKYMLRITREFDAYLVLLAQGADLEESDPIKLGRAIVQVRGGVFIWMSKRILEILREKE